MRILHLADAHLDTPFAGRAEGLRRRLRDASREALRRAFDTALAERVHAVLIAGDLFDGERLSFRTEGFLLEQLARLGREGVPVVYAAGNHDPGQDAYRTRRIGWPAHVTVVADRTPRRVAIADREGETVGWVTAAGHATRRETADLSRAFPRAGGPLPEVALLHTHVHESAAADEHEPYAPSQLSGLRAGGYDYWALGHVHERQCLSDEPGVWYAGNLQGRTHREPGARGGLVVDLAERARPRVHFRSFAPVRWETVTVGKLEDADSLDRLLRRIRSAWEDARNADGGDGVTGWIARFVLEGGSPLWAQLADDEERAALAIEVQEALGLLDVEIWTRDLHPAVRVEQHRSRQDVLGATLRLLEQVRAGETALAGLVPEELEGLDRPDVADPHAYVRSLLQGAEGEIVSRMLDRRRS